METINVPELLRSLPVDERGRLEQLIYQDSWSPNNFKRHYFEITYGDGDRGNIYR